MRLWSLSPIYLDNLGLSRCYNEGIGGLKAMLGLQDMHKNHPQLERFKKSNDALNNLRFYLYLVYNESLSRKKKYKNSNLIFVEEFFNCGKINQIPVTKQQVLFEVNWLHDKMVNGKKGKLFRGKDSLRKVDRLQWDVFTYKLKLHPLFYLVDGEIESWEKSIKYLPEEKYVYRKEKGFLELYE